MWQPRNPQGANWNGCNPCWWSRAFYPYPQNCSTQGEPARALSVLSVAFIAARRGRAGGFGLGGRGGYCAIRRVFGCGFKGCNPPVYRAGAKSAEPFLTLLLAPFFSPIESTIDSSAKIRQILLNSYRTTPRTLSCPPFLTSPIRISKPDLPRSAIASKKPTRH